MSKSTIAAEIVRRLPDLIKDSPANAETVIRGMLDELDADRVQPSPVPDYMLPPEGKWYAVDEKGQPIIPLQKDLRDEFAMAALTSIPAGYFNEIANKVLAAYEIADAMLEQRKKP